jgi:beta-lactamase class A
MFSIWIQLDKKCDYTEVVRSVGDQMLNQHNYEQIRELAEKCISMHINFRVEAW